MTCRDKVGHNHIILKTWLLWVQHWNPLLYLSPINVPLKKKKACIPHSHCCHVSIWKLNTFTAIYKPGARVYIMLPWGLKTNHLQQAKKITHQNWCNLHPSWPCLLQAYLRVLTTRPKFLLHFKIKNFDPFSSILCCLVHIKHRFLFSRKSPILTGIQYQLIFFKYSAK